MLGLWTGVIDTSGDCVAVPRGVDDSVVLGEYVEVPRAVNEKEL